VGGGPEKKKRRVIGEGVPKMWEEGSRDWSRGESGSKLQSRGWRRSRETRTNAQEEGTSPSQNKNRRSLQKPGKAPNQMDNRCWEKGSTRAKNLKQLHLPSPPNEKSIGRGRRHKEKSRLTKETISTEEGPHSQGGEKSVKRGGCKEEQLLSPRKKGQGTL